jgi:hypothetical protein
MSYTGYGFFMGGTLLAKGASPSLTLFIPKLGDLLKTLSAET